MKPIKVTEADIAFGGDISKLLPSMEEIPAEFHNGQNKWNKVVGDWFFSGLKNCKWVPKEGIQTIDALRHVKAILGSWEIKHEHKEAGCAYLLSQFFDEVYYDKSN